MTNRLVQFVRLPASERALLLEALAGLTVGTVLVKLVHFRRLAPRLGRHMAESPPTADRALVERARQIGWAIDATVRRLPWKPVCLPQAVTAQWMLRRRGIPSTLYLGVDPTGEYQAHAWVRSGGLIVTGGPRRTEFAVVSSFA